MAREVCMTIGILFATLLIELVLVVLCCREKLERCKNDQKIKNADMADFITERLIKEIFSMLNMLAGNDIDFHRQIAVWQERYKSMLSRELDIIAVTMYLLAVMSSHKKVRLIPDIKRVLKSVQDMVSSLAMKDRDDYPCMVDEFLKIVDHIRDIKKGRDR